VNENNAPAVRTAPLALIQLLKCERGLRATLGAAGAGVGVVGSGMVETLHSAYKKAKPTRAVEPPALAWLLFPQSGIRL